MHLSLKTTYLTGAVNLLLWLFCQAPALALDGHVTERTPFCLKAEKPCRTIFHLNPTDSLKILRQSLDEKWYLVKYAKTEQEGWVEAAFIQLKLPQKLSSKNVALPSDIDVQALRVHNKKLQILSSNSSLDLFSEQTPIKIVGLEQLLSSKQQRWSALDTAQESPVVVGVTEETDEQFVQAIKTGVFPQIQFNTLIKLNKDEDFKGSVLIQDQFIILLAKGLAPWGESCLSVLDTEHIPLMLFNEDRELLNYLPHDLVSNIRPESIKLLSLDQGGLLLTTAYHIHKRGHILMLLRFDPKEIWVYEGLYHWPKELSINPKSSDFKARALKLGEHFFLMVESKTKAETYLAFYAGKNDPVTLQALDEPVIDAILYEEELWTLHKNKLLHWSPVFAP